MFLHQPTELMDGFMKVAKSNTDKNLETCGVLAGSLVSTTTVLLLSSMLNNYICGHFNLVDVFLELNSSWRYLITHFLLIATEKQKILHHCSHYPKARIDFRFGML